MDPDTAPDTPPASSSSSRLVTATTALAATARTTLAGASGPALRRGILGSVLLTLGSYGAGALPVDGGPAAAVGLLGFTFGHGQILALILCWVGVALLVTSWLSLGPRAMSGRLPTRDAVWATALWSLPLLPAIPVFSRDAWSYLAQGAMTAAGADPYEFGPEANPGPFTDEVSPDWRSTETPYGPLHLLLMRIIVGMSGGHPTAGVFLLRLAVLAALAALVALVVAAARRTGVDAAAAVWMACASPIAVIHLAGGLHNEIFPLVACLAAVVFTFDGRRASAGAAIGIAVAFKATAVIVAPFLLWIALAQRRGDPAARRPVVRSLRDTVFAAAAAVAVFALITLVSGTGLGWLGAIAVSDRVINYLSAPTAVAHIVHAVADSPGFEDVLAVTRRAGQVVLALTLVAVWWFHRRDRLTAVRGIMLALLAFVVLNSLAWPWYHVWVAAFWVLARPGRRATTAAVGVSVFLVMAIGPNGSTSLYSPALVAISVIASLLAGWWWWWRATDVVRTPSPERAG
ncbi:polyprenol phosphomannose-dependent alpha 1,6 mannosyltransferase MptB [Rhodococcus sp. IEGM 1408]|uniref:polyprenol phosphomannose-dependent alpha 1,6 mannosyltransferase MptB n=1 Tax=Rhodococcus sp. IEGM 1408 TaxID=3082220 RepID=UPI002952F7E9|nr:polyprenol phosphomannose-dependent alpha 1,6 mannosyltransferase MptB [Rhodococcus sp. IEGM 1408]MDV8001865.1 polyprenol phosphomannose-dependent alpha 1,6 mannosyltransferase MptB [Rhodococcus sp. IEGM 1408]